jgi:hypothetical protein
VNGRFTVPSDVASAELQKNCLFKNGLSLRCLQKPSEISLIAYKQTGRTNCALIKYFDYVTCSLKQNDYIRCLLVDFSKAFDTVDHALVVRKLKGLGFPGRIVNWVISFLIDRFQLIKINGCLSDKLPINSEIVQGSGIGPYLYFVMESDLHPVSRKNEMFKHADDINLLVPQHIDGTLHIEFNNIL